MGSRARLTAAAAVWGIAAVAGVAAGGAAAAAAAAGEKVPRIVHGQPAEPGAYPWMSALVNAKEPAEDGEFCGGALIRPTLVLTAAHCVADTAPREFDVVVGRYRLSDRDGERIDVKKVAQNPRFQPIGATLRYDVAQVRLKERATPEPIALAGPEDAALTAPGQPALVLGWGLIEEGGVEFPDELYQVDLAIVSDRDCRDAYPTYQRRTLLCAAAPGKDSCQGDSGGPLIVADGAGGWLEVGTVSSGTGCARPNFPGLYGRVSALRGFILERHPTFAPFSVSRPYITGDPSAGRRLVCHKGRWASEPLGFDYLWTLVRGGAPTRGIGGGKTYQVEQRFRGRRVACVVFAGNEGGFSERRSRSVRMHG